MGWQIYSANSETSTDLMKILVSGATGFIGNYVIAELLRLGHTVIATSANRGRAEKMAWFGDVKYVEFKLEDFDSSENYYDYFSQPEKLIHLAWEGLPNYKSLFHFEINLPRHYGFLKNIIHNGCKDITVTGTCFEYGMKEGKLTEDQAAEPANPYGLAKHTLNRLLSEFQREESFILRWVRLFYLYGKGQNPNSLLSQLDAALERNDSVFNMSGGEQVRDFLPVDLAAAYIVKIAFQNKYAGIINCCSGQPITVKEFVKRYLKGKGKTLHLNLGYYDYPDYEPMAFWGDNKKLQLILNE